MLLLAIRPEAVAAAIGNNSISSGVEGAQQLPHYPAQRFLCVNTHLLFPHNEYSTKIRLREITKILGYVEAYKQKELCTTICGRADVSYRVYDLLLFPSCSYRIYLKHFA